MWVKIIAQKSDTELLQNFFWTKIWTPHILCSILTSLLVINAASQKVKKIGLFGYPSIISLTTIFIGCCILLRIQFEYNALPDEGFTYLESPNNSAILGLLYVSVGSFILFLLIFAFWFSINRFRKFQMPKLYLRTPKGSLESQNVSQYTPLISDV